MRVLELLNSLYEETLPINKNTNVRKRGILLLDIDDTLLKAQNIFIWRKLPTDKEEVKLTPDQYSKESVTAETKPHYDYREFRDAVKVRASIKSGIPYVNNLKVVDDFVNGGFVLGVLTARGMEDVVYEAINEFLKYRDKNGVLQPVKIPRNLMFAVNDDNKKYPGNTDYEKKANVIKKLEKHFDYVYFMDDDMKNIKAIKAMKKTLPTETAKKIRTITATNPKDEAVNEETLLEMAMNMFADKKLVDLVETDPKAAGHYYINMVIKDNPSKYGNLSWKAAATKIASYGLSKSGSAAVRKGEVTPEFVEKLKNGLKLAQADEPEEEKAKRLANQGKEEEAAKIKAKDIETKKNSDFGKYQLDIEEVKKEKERVKISLNTLVNGLNKTETMSGSSSTTSSVKVLDREMEFSEYVDEVNKKVIPSFILNKKFDNSDIKLIEKEIEGKEFRRKGVETKVRMEMYISHLNRTISMFDEITREAGNSEEEKVEALNNDKYFQKYLASIKQTIKNKSSNKEKALKVSRMEKRRSSGGGTKDVDSVGVTDALKDYFVALEEIEKSFEDGSLRDFVKNNFPKIRDMVQKSSDAIKKGDSKYRKPEGFDNEPIEEADENDIVDGIDSLGPRVKRIAKARKGNGYTYSGIERNDPEIEYLYNYGKEGKGNDSKAFRILVNIYLDFIDGMSVVVGSKNKGLLGNNEVVNKKREIIGDKEEIYSKMGPNKNDASKLTPEEAKKVVLWKIDRMVSSKETNKVEIKKTVNSFDFTKLNKITINSLVKAATESIDSLSEVVETAKFSTISDMSEQELYKLVENRISEMTSSQKFQNRTAVVINFVKKTYSKEDLKILAQSTFNDPTGEKFLSVIKDSRFSQKR